MEWIKDQDATETQVIHSQWSGEWIYNENELSLSISNMLAFL